MNYLTEIRLFYDFIETHPMTPSAIALWHGLMFIANRLGWEEEFTIPVSVLETRTGIPSTTLFRIRKQLQDCGLIEVISHGGRACASYRILSLESQLAFQNGKQNERQMEVKSDDNAENGGFAFQNGKQSGSINKRKQDVDVSHQKKQTKKKSGFSLEEWVAALESPWKELMRIWLEYKRSRKETYASLMGANACLKKLKELSGGSPEVAQQIIEQSMASNWAGLFPVKSVPGARGHPVAPATGQRIGQIMQPDTEEHRNSILQKFKNGVNK